MQACLTLNASFEPLKMIPAKRAVRLILLGKAELVEKHEHKTLRSERQELPLPAVIRLVKFIKVPQRFRRKVTNTFLFARDRYTCMYCGRKQENLNHNRRESLNRDHIIPRSRGGDNSWENCVTACSTCNSKKDDRTPQEAGLKLRCVPTAPRMVHLRWNVRRMTEKQRKYIVLFYGEEVLEAIS